MKKFLFWFAVAERRQAETHLIILDSVQKKLEFQPKGTARNRNRILEPKWGRAEGATLMHSPRRIQNPKGFSTLRVAQKVRFDP